MEYADVVGIALRLPDVAESIAYGGPCVKRAGRMMFAPGRETNCLAVKLDWETHDRLLDESPEKYFKTAHYETWPWLLARLDSLDADDVEMLVNASWEDAPKPAKRRR